MAVSINETALDDLLKNYQTPEEIIGENGLLKQLTKAIVERALNAELTDLLGYEKHSQTGNNTGNSRNGHSQKTLKGEFGTVPIDIPRDRNGNFEPRIIQKNRVCQLFCVNGFTFLILWHSVFVQDAELIQRFFPMVDWPVPFGRYILDSQIDQLKG